MSKYRSALPQLMGGMFLTDGGLETTLIYHRGIELPAFAAFDLLKNEAGTAILRSYYEGYAQLANRHGMGLVLESPTWRANRDWGARLGYDEEGLARLNDRSIDLMLEVRARHERPATPMVVSGNIGPRADGYRPEKRMSTLQACVYHIAQVRTFAQSGADMIAAFTMNYVEEAVGVVMAAQTHAMPVAISFTVETDGRLPTGQSLADAIARTDDESGGYPIYYMVNCAHPLHFAHVLDGGEWVRRIRGIRANASMRDHADLDFLTELDAGDPQELARQYRSLADQLPNLTVVGGCCGTDERHVDEICRALAPAMAEAA